MEILEDIALEFRTDWTIHKATVTWMKLVLSVSVLMLLLRRLHRWCFLYALPKEKKSLCNLMADTLFAHWLTNYGPFDLAFSTKWPSS